MIANIVDFKGFFKYSKIFLKYAYLLVNLIVKKIIFLIFTLIHNIKKNSIITML